MNNTGSSQITETEKNSFLLSAGLILTACISGWIIMELEILGVRMLAPYFGSAIYVVTGSVIGVFLLSLAFGYMFGGWLSSISKSIKPLSIALTAAGSWMCVLPFIVGPVCESIFNTELDEKWGSLIASLILFGIPTMLLGTVSPTIVHRITKQAGKTGFNAGMVLALSTVASFLGCVITAFYLVLYSIRQTLIISGAALVFAGLIILYASIVSQKKLKTGPEIEQ